MMIEYRLLKEIDSNPHHTQRSLASTLGVSLGKINYLIGGLAEKGILKAKKIRNEPDAIRWHYVLTPQGIQEKMCITRDYLLKRKAEYAALRAEIAELESEVSGESGSFIMDCICKSA